MVNLLDKMKSQLLSWIKSRAVKTWSSIKKGWMKSSPNNNRMAIFMKSWTKRTTMTTMISTQRMKKKFGLSKKTSLMKNTTKMTCQKVMRSGKMRKTLWQKKIWMKKGKIKKVKLNSGSIKVNSPFWVR